MEVNILFLITTALAHLLADFFLQNSWMAKGKSERFEPLAVHCLVYAGVMLIPFLFFFNILFAFFAAGLIYVCHIATDGFTSCVSKHYFEKGEIRKGFMVIGVDQTLHFFQILLAYFLFSR